MELTRYQKELCDTINELMGANSLKENEDYAIFFNEEMDIKTGMKKMLMLLQLKNDNNIVKQFKRLGWKINHKYYSSGNIGRYSEGDFKDNYGDIEFIQLKFNML